MSENYAVAGRGLKTMFLGQIIALLGFIPVIGAIALVAGGIMSLVGLFTAMPAHPNYKNVLYMIGAGIVVSLVSGVVNVISGGGNLLTGLLSIGATLLSLAQVYFVCNATSSLLREIGDKAVAQKGDQVFLVNTICYGLSILATILLFVFAPLAAILSIGELITSVIALVLYIIFLYKSYEALLG